MKSTNNMWYNLSLLSQLAVSFLTPIFMMIFICTFLKNKLGLGNWIILAGILLGLGSGISMVWKYLKKSIKDANDRQSEYEKRYR